MSAASLPASASRPSRTARPASSTAVSDNVRSPEATYYYEIVPGGLDEDVPAYVDRKHEWNGVDGAGIPACLLGADYVRTFNDDRYLRDYEMEVRLARTADLYVFLDPRMQIPAWLSSQFVDTGLKIGIDEVQWQHPEDGRPVCTGAVLARARASTSTASARSGRAALRPAKP